MELILIRHAQPAWIVDGGGVNDPGLTPRGVDQADRLGSREDLAPLDAIWVSPARRAQETAAPLAAAHGLQPEVHPWLREAETPDFTALSIEEVGELFRSARRRSIADWWMGFPGAEDLRSFNQRVALGLDEQLAVVGARRDHTHGHPLWHEVPRGRRVAIVSHAGTTGSALGHLLCLPPVPWAWERFHVDHASITRVRTTAISDGLIFGLRVLNDTEHVPESERTR